jgi:hypothetical protein
LIFNSPFTFAYYLYPIPVKIQLKLSDCAPKKNNLLFTNIKAHTNIMVASSKTEEEGRGQNYQTENQTKEHAAMKANGKRNYENTKQRD